jgi:hypothetical protein
MSLRVVRWIVLAGLAGAAIALLLLLPLPASDDIFAARRWGVGAGYVGLVLGFPIGMLGMPVVVALHPYPVGNDASGAGIMAALITLVVAADWAIGASFLALLADAIRIRRTPARGRHRDHPPNER